jgi:hypothetical protein
MIAIPIVRLLASDQSPRFMDWLNDKLCGTQPGFLVELYQLNCSYRVQRGHSVQRCDKRGYC